MGSLRVGLMSGFLYDLPYAQRHRAPPSLWYEGSDMEGLEKRPLGQALVFVFFCSNYPGPRP